MEQGQWMGGAFGQHDGSNFSQSAQTAHLTPIGARPTAPLDAGGARLIVAGVGGGGTNAVNRMIDAGVKGVEYLAINTDAQALELARAPKRLRIGETLTRGLGAGGNPTTGMQAAEESYASIRETLAGADMVFITAGMGGGTGTGASAIVAQAAREQGALTVGVVTTPFGFERRRKMLADQGLAALREVVDALIVVPNERLMQLAARDTSAFEAYRLADDVLRLGIQGISDLITVPGLINLDFADIRAVMADAGTAFIAVSEASGEKRAETLTRLALTNPLLEMDIRGARGMVFNITGGDDLTMHEVGAIADAISNAAHPDANVIFGTVYDATCAGTLKLTIVATGFEPRAITGAPQTPRVFAHTAYPVAAPPASHAAAHTPAGMPPSGQPPMSAMSGRFAFPSTPSQPPMREPEHVAWAGESGEEAPAGDTLRGYAEQSQPGVPGVAVVPFEQRRRMRSAPPLAYLAGMPPASAAPSAYVVEDEDEDEMEEVAPPAQLSFRQDRHEPHGSHPAQSGPTVQVNPYRYGRAPVTHFIADEYAESPDGQDAPEAESAHRGIWDRLFPHH